MTTIRCFCVSNLKLQSPFTTLHGCPVGINVIRFPAANRPIGKPSAGDGCGTTASYKPASNIYKSQGGLLWPRGVCDNGKTHMPIATSQPEDSHVPCRTVHPKTKVAGQ